MSGSDLKSASTESDEASLVMNDAAVDNDNENNRDDAGYGGFDTRE